MVVTDNMKAKRFVNGLKEYLFGAVPLTRTSTYSDVLDTACVLRRGLKRGRLSENPARRPRQRDKDLDRLKPLGQE